MRNEREGAAKYPNNKTVRNIRYLAAEIAVTAIGVSSFAAAGIDFYNLDKSINGEVNNRYTQTVSIEELQQAQRETLLFDKEVHNLISRNELRMDSALFDPKTLQNVRQDITLIKQEADKEELRQRLEKENHVILHMLGIMFAAAVGGGLSIFGLHYLPNKKKRSDKEQH